MQVPPGNPEIQKSEIPIWDQRCRIFKAGTCRKTDVFVILGHFVHSTQCTCWFCYLAPTFFGTPINYGCSNVPALLCHMKTSSKPCYIIYPSLWSFGCCLFLLSRVTVSSFIFLNLLLVFLFSCIFFVLLFFLLLVVHVSCQYLLFFFFLFLLLFSLSFLFCYDSTHQPPGSDQPEQCDQPLGEVEATGSYAKSKGLLNEPSKLGIQVLWRILPAGWWQLKHFFIFTSIWGRFPQFDEHIFQMGWFNHQPARYRLSGLSLGCPAGSDVSSRSLVSWVSYNLFRGRISNLLRLGL